MTERYVEDGVEYFLPEFGPAESWNAVVMLKHPPATGTALTALERMPRIHYREWDAAAYCRREIQIFEDGRFRLARPGHFGHLLPEGDNKSFRVIEDEHWSSRHMTKLEFEALWAALQREEMKVGEQ